MTEKPVNIHDLNGPQLVSAYNSIRSGKPPIKKFRDLDTGRRLLTAAMNGSTPSQVAVVLQRVVADTQEVAEPAKPVTEAKVEKTTKGKVASRSKNKSGISPDSEVQVIDEAYGTKGRETQTIKRWKKFLETKTVGEYCDKVGLARGLEDVKWWMDNKRISLKR